MSGLECPKEYQNPNNLLATLLDFEIQHNYIEAWVKDSQNV
jgi:hypothetical protein